MALKRTLLWLLFSLTVFAALIAGAHAQSGRSAAIETASREIADVRRAVDDDSIEEPEALENRLREIRDGSRQRLGAIERELEANRAQIELLGPAPGENDPPESDFLAEERAALNETRARLSGQRTRVLANIYETGDLLARLSSAQLGALYRSLTERGVSPLSPEIWSGAAQSALDVGDRFSRYFSGWSDRKKENGVLTPTLFAVFAAIIISLMLFGPVRGWVISTFTHQVQRRTPTASRRIFVAAMTMIARTAPGVIGGLVIIETLRATGVLTDEGENAARAFWIGVLAVLTVSGFTSGYFSPRAPSWRIAKVDVARGKIISRLAMVIVVVFSVKILFTAIAVAARADESLILLIKAVSSITVGAFLFLICRTRLWRAEAPANEDEPLAAADNGGAWRLIRRLGRVLAGAIIIATLAGYIVLADFVVTRLCLLALIVGVAWLLRAMLAELALRMRAQLAVAPEEAAAAEETSANFRFWSRLIINIVLFAALAPVILVLFGVPAESVRDLGGQALFGFNIGGFHVPSIAKLFYAILVFIILMAVTRLVQSGLKRGPLAHSRADIGVQNSLTTLVGYAGLVIAMFFGISALGFDLSNLALIAGALSVGIGFGLQSIVNNFVSGLILLFERPIKVGDWIITNSGEGTVKKISVRSTEIETFDRSSIIIPNSELISSAVTNWTHKNKLGRITVPVGVSYNADPELVRDILMKCAKEEELIVSYPEPFVTWMDFGASSLDFELRAYLRDISEGLRVRTALRFAIFKALAEAGVEIPFPQRDVHIKSLPEDYEIAHRDKMSGGHAEAEG
ncbi:mechanosensitive ion channel domain-containing protein [Hyphococcus sp.]|uniref:mechanosensitive ion channel family protein n=1 Tax=Hyphococcus sp. TaxID=2038636 RepID=UPI003CCBFA41